MYSCIVHIVVQYNYTYNTTIFIILLILIESVSGDAANKKRYLNYFNCVAFADQLILPKETVKLVQMWNVE